MSDIKKAGTCIIIGAGDLTVGSLPYKPDTDYVIAADGGLMYCGVLELEPDLILGDFDSLGYVPQKAVMFTGTVSSNVSYGDNGRNKPSDIKIKEAIDVDQGTDFVTQMEDSYESHIARGGTNVSGGQKQRLAIARAIARDPEIYIFDDSFSALDYKTDAALRKGIKEHFSETTSIIITQRISSIVNCDHILVIDDGDVVGYGSHEELLNNVETATSSNVGSVSCSV